MLITLRAEMVTSKTLKVNIFDVKNPGEWSPNLC